MKDYMHKVMKYGEITKRTDPEEIATKGEVDHFMRVSVYNRELSMVGTKDPYMARRNGEKLYEEELKALKQMIGAVLKQK